MFELSVGGLLLIIRECTVVTFLRIPYAEAARRQDRIVYASLIAAALSVLL